MPELIDIRPFDKTSKYELELCGLRRDMPLYRIDTDLWIAANEHLCFGCDTEFTEKTGREIASRLERFQPQVLLAPEAKSLALAYEVARNLGHEGYAIARKTAKPYSSKSIAVNIKSITTKSPQKLFLDEPNIEKIRGKNIALIDDVISTGGTIAGLKELAEKAGATVCAIATIWVEGPWPFDKFGEEIRSESLIFLGSLPIFAAGEVYKNLVEHKKKVERNYNTSF